MSQTQSREIRLVRYPKDLPGPDTFHIETVTLEPPAEGEVQVRNTWMTVDPYMRNRLKGVDTYVPAFKLGEPLSGGAVGTVLQSRNARFREGDTVLSMMGWREAFNAPADSLQKLDTSLPSEAYLGVAGLPGFTAYIGLLKVAKVQAGETVFVSAASGAVGSVVCQIAKLKGAHVIGSAGGTEKCNVLREIGVDAAIDYKSTPDLTEALRAAAPKGLDIYFDNVGGAHLDAALEIAKPRARFALCGMISRYSGSESAVSNLIYAVQKSLFLQGFIATDYYSEMPAFLGDMTGWIKDGKITWRQTVDEGLDKAPAALLKLFSGENLGKMLVKL